MRLVGRPTRVRYEGSYVSVFIKIIVSVVDFHCLVLT